MPFAAARFSLLLLVSCVLGASTSVAESNSDDRRRVEATMKRATHFMVDKVSCEGGYVWAYLPDLSRRWGELEARASMIWIQPPGTASMGDVFLEAYAATGDEYYYEAASGVARALIRAQHPSGGWNYCADFAGEATLRDWYTTVGRNAWRLEEFQHYYGNATFDDSVTAAAARFLLHMYSARHDEAYRSPLDRAIQFVLDAQYENGAWPQRFPLMSGFSKDGNPDYTGFCTFNDDVAAENIDLLRQCARVLNDPRLDEAARRGMDAFLLAQLPQPQPGWALQYAPDLQPAGARTYEPRALCTHATAENIEQLFTFYRVTGDARYLARVDEALDWLDAVALPEELRKTTGRTHPTFVEMGTNQPLYLHRSGSNATNGRYYADRDPTHTVAHYASFRVINVPHLRRELAKRKSTTPGSKSPAAEHGGRARSHSIDDVLRALNTEGYWPAPLARTSHPYCGDAPTEVAAGDFSQTLVGDAWDTSPYVSDVPVIGISTATYIENMRALIGYLASVP